jgi:hypothetical protein
VRVAANKSAGSGAARHQETGPHGGLHRSPPHRLPPDRLRLASGWPNRSAGQGEPRPQLGSGDPVRPAVKEGIFFYLKIPGNRFPLLKILENPF